MKDLPHHMKKLNRRIIRSENRLLETELEAWKKHCANASGRTT